MRNWIIIDVTEIKSISVIVKRPDLVEFADLENRRIRLHTLCQRSFFVFVLVFATSAHGGE